MNIFNARINRISEILIDIGQVFLASIFIPFILEKFDIKKAVIGLMFSLICWTASVLLVKIKA